MPLFWLRVALVLYGVGLLYALAAFWGGRDILTRITVPAVALGMNFHFVALIENAMLSGVWAPASMHEMESLLAFLLMVFFFVVYARYRTTSPGIAVFPLAFLLTLSAGSGPTSTDMSTPLFVSRQWIYIHVGLIFIGYSALVFTFVASILYLIQERTLKTKNPKGIWTRLPALAVIDDIGYKSLLWGFPFMTLGLISGAIVAEARVGSQYFLDAKIALSILSWVLYMILLYTRWSAGWRGRRAAYLATFAFATAVLAWAANSLSRTHRFIAP
jgi:ABC-type uncharacterized transport system permease subunit